MNEVTISLGYNCDPRIYMKKKLNITKATGYKSCPFDLCITPYKALCKILETDFCDFFDDMKIIKWGNAKGDRTLAGPGLTVVSNKHDMIFNHEGGGHSHLFQEGKNDDEFYTRNNYEKFKERYTQRIENFRRYCKEFDKIKFIYNKSANSSEKFDESYIKNLIIKTYGKKTINFVSLN